MQLGVLKNKKGFSVIEILAVIAIVAISFSSLLGMTILSMKAAALQKETSQADDLAQEAMEAVRNFRDGTTWDTNGLGTVVSGSDYHIQSSGTPPAWELLPGSETIGNFTRKIVFSDVMRDSNFDIVTSGGTVDPDTKLVTVTVDWSGREVKLEAYFTNWRK